MEMKKNPTKIYVMQVVNFDWNSLLPCYITFIYTHCGFESYVQPYLRGHPKTKRP